MNGRAPIEITCTTDETPRLEVDQHSVTALRCDTGLSRMETRWGTFTDPWTTQPLPHCGFVFIGSDGTIESRDYAPHVTVQTRANSTPHQIPADQLAIGRRNAIEYVLNCIATNSPITGPLNPELSLTAQRIVKTAARSARENVLSPLLSNPMRVVIIGLGQMGRSHALAHQRHGSDITGLVNRSPMTLPPELMNYPQFLTFDDALETKPDLVVIATYAYSHASLAIQAMQAGAHVFVEKPLAITVEDAEKVAKTAHLTDRKLVVGYILRHHPSWQGLIRQSRTNGGPYVFRMNLNQQSSGAEWAIHKALMRSTSPLVDCGVHYVDVMCQITDAKPLRVQGIGLRLSDEIAPDMYNYGQLQVVFEDGSVGWYEAGWGPMMSETACFVKDVISPNGSVSIIDPPKVASSDVDGHTSVGGILIHRTTGDTLIKDTANPGHQGLCDPQQAYMLRAITENFDLTRPTRDAIESLRICLAADESIRRGQAVSLV